MFQWLEMTEDGDEVCSLSQPFSTGVKMETQTVSPSVYIELDKFGNYVQSFRNNRVNQ